jgi:predicted extracellular nuclease
VVRKATFENDYGWTAKISFEDAAGRLVFWSTSSSDLSVGDVVALRGTVKDLGEFNGRKQTVVTRCKVVEEPESAAA